ncbi:MAG: terminase [Rikenellaceae bacterium]
MNIVKENEKRNRELKKSYNPLLGLGSPLKRVKLYFSPTSYQLIPKIMVQKDVLIKEIIAAGSLEEYAVDRDIPLAIVEAYVTSERLKYDFEYWAASCVKIQDKQTKRIVPFIMRRPQIKLFKLLIEELYADNPIRVILLKARQWGGSTLIQVFMAWIQLFHRKGWHSVIVADVEEQSRNIRAMYSRLAQYHPDQLFKVVLRSFEGSSKNKIIDGRDSIIYMGSMQKPDALRSSDVMMAHLTEVGLWKSTEGKQPEDVVQSVAGSVPLEPYSIIVMESTAKGVGNYFHRQWQKATRGENGYKPLFVAWYEIEIYSKPFTSKAERDKFIASMSDEEMEIFKLGATLEAINWYRAKKHGDSYDDWRMACEFPTTELEAFQSTGRRAHAPNYIAQMRKYCKEPIFKGEMFADSQTGKGAIDKSLHFEECEGGDFWVWALPDTKEHFRDRYVVSMDIGGRTKIADWSVISVIDRLWRRKEGVEECIATYRFHLDQDLAVWRAVQVATFYSKALLVVEANSLNSQSTDGDHSLTILDEIKDVYPNLYCRSDPQRIVEGLPLMYGFFTSRASKTDLVNQMNRRFRECGYIERDVRALDEADCYEIKDDGSYGAVVGEHDDIYMSRAIGLKASDMLNR